MTLNLMLTSRSSVYLSGDFRITYHSDGRWEDNFNIQKLIPIFRFRWSALVSFTGVAKTPDGREVGEWIAGKLEAIEKDAKFDELPKALLTADSWLKNLSNHRRLAFSAVGFVGRRPAALIVSNFLDINGQVFDPVLPTLRLSQIRPKVPEVRVAGDRRAVPDDETQKLKRMLLGNPNPREIQQALAEVNVAAAQRSRTISQECVTGHLLPTGAAEVTPHGIDAQVEYLPGFVKRSLAAQNIRGFKCKLDESGKPLRPRWVGMTARVQGAQSKEAVVAVMHAISNIAEPISDGPPSDSAVFWKIAEENEPARHTFQIHPPNSS